MKYTNPGESKTQEKDSFLTLKNRKNSLEEKSYNILFKSKFWISAFSLGGVFGILYIANIFTNNIIFPVPIIQKVVFYIVLGGLAGCFIYGFVAILLSSLSRTSIHHIKLQLNQLETEKLQDVINDKFSTTLVQLNYKYLDQFYLQTKKQSDKSFLLIIVLSTAGLIIITAGMIKLFYNNTNGAYIITGTGLTIEVITAAYFYLYNKNVQRMSRFQQKLLLTQNISLAVKISDDMDDKDKSDSKQMIVDRLTSDINKFLSRNND